MGKDAARLKIEILIIIIPNSPRVGIAQGKLTHAQLAMPYTGMSLTLQPLVGFPSTLHVLRTLILRADTAAEATPTTKALACCSSCCPT